MILSYVGNYIKESIVVSYIHAHHGSSIESSLKHAIDHPEQKEVQFESLWLEEALDSSWLIELAIKHDWVDGNKRNLLHYALGTEVKLEYLNTLIDLYAKHGKLQAAINKHDLKGESPLVLLQERTDIPDSDQYIGEKIRTIENHSNDGGSFKDAIYSNFFSETSLVSAVALGTVVYYCVNELYKVALLGSESETVL